MNNPLNRDAKSQILSTLGSGRSVLLLGPRQTGKTTLIKTLDYTLYITFADPRVRLRYEANPGLLIDEVSSLDGKNKLVIIDEVQKVPLIMDAVQYLIDDKIAQFVLTGSSARKLKHGNEINLLPGRVIPFYLDSLTLNEIPEKDQKLCDLLNYGSLPEVITTSDEGSKELLLDGYVITYLEEEIRAEGVVRNLGNFSRFLELAASESGYIMNMSKLSQQVGVASTTIESYFQILLDCLIAWRIEPITTSKTRHRLTKAPKFLFFDLGVRRVAAREGASQSDKLLGHLFEQLVGMEIVRQLRISKPRARLRYWQDRNGPEVDWVLEHEKKYIPIEVKFTDKPSISDAKHLKLFMSEYSAAQKAYVICKTPNKMKLADNIYAINWLDIFTELFESL